MVGCVENINAIVTTPYAGKVDLLIKIFEILYCQYDCAGSERTNDQMRVFDSEPSRQSTGIGATHANPWIVSHSVRLGALYILNEESQIP